MSKGDTIFWKEEFFDTAKQKAMFDIGTFKTLIDQIRDFSPYDAPKDVIYEKNEDGKCHHQGTQFKVQDAGHQVKT